MGYSEEYSGKYKYVKQRHGVGFNQHTLYPTWRMMNVRCYDTRHKAYHRYGGRGIEVAYEWRWDNPEAFSNFISVVGDRPEGMTLDRPNNDLGYSPTNWKWSTKREQQNNLGVGMNNKSGVMGVSWLEDPPGWIVQIVLFGRNQNIGIFNPEDKEKAVERFDKVKSVKVSQGDQAALDFYVSLKDLTPTGKQIRRNKASKYYGVAKGKGLKWRAYTNEYVSGKLKQINLGAFLTEELAYAAVLERLKFTGG